MADTPTPPLKPRAADAPLSPGDLDRTPVDGMGLCLSGGGYRAMLYHIGALTRLNQLGLLPKLTEISAVSGGAITAAQLALAWPKLAFDVAGVATNLAAEVAEPIMRFAKVGVDIRAIVEGDLLPGVTPAQILSNEYDRHLLHGADLADVPTSPRFTFFATNMQTGRAWAFDAEQALDARVGVIERPADRPFFRLADVVAASSAFPPLLSPYRLDLSRFTVKPLPWGDLYRPPYTTEAELADGGIYDNFASERVMRHCRTILISNAGATMPDVARDGGDPISQALRSSAILDQRVEDERLARLQQFDRSGERVLGYWSIHKPMANYGIADPLKLTPEQTTLAGGIRTRLDPFSDAEITLLLQAGYAGADAGLRARGLVDDRSPGSFATLPPLPQAAPAPSLLDELRRAGKGIESMLHLA